MSRIIFLLMLSFILPVAADVFAQTEKSTKPESPQTAADIASEISARQEMDMFYEAQKEARDGNPQAARDLLERISAKQPAGAFQDDALYEMARISDEVEHNYSDAIKRYELMAQRFPNSRPTRRALRRADYLKKAISTGEERFARYEAVMKNSSINIDPLKEIAEVKDILSGDTPFALEWDALLWMAAKYRSLDNCAEAVEVYERMEEKTDDQAKQREAMLGRADCLLTMGNVYRARTLFEKLAKSEGFGRETATNKLHGMNQSATRNYMRYLSASVLLIVLAVFIAALIKKRFSIPDSYSPPFELLFITPVFLAAFAAALQKGKFAWQAVGLTVATATVAIYIAPILVNSLKSNSLKARVLLFVCFAMTLFSLIYLIIDFGNMYDQIIYDIEQNL